MKKWRCSVCGYIWEGETPPVQCPVCRAATDKFVEMTGEREKSENPASGRSPGNGAARPGLAYDDAYGRSDPGCRYMDLIHEMAVKGKSVSGASIL